MVETPMRLNGELIISGIIFIAACLLLYVASGFTPSRMSDQVGPALWPKAIRITFRLNSEAMPEDFRDTTNLAGQARGVRYEIICPIAP